MRRFISITGVLALFGVLVASVGAGTVLGTNHNDVLRGTAKADKLYGKAGNDKLFGLAGIDYLNGGPGNDTVTGGPGADVLVCGPGLDIATADATDKVAADCETVTGLPKPTVSATNVTQVEGNAPGAMNFSVTLAKATQLKVTLAYATADGTATAGSDYTAKSGTLTFAPGETAKTVSVPIVGDTAFEPDETFTLTLSNPANATLGGATATGTITNDDVAKAKPGHYHGPITSGGFVDFDVSPDSTAVSNLVIIPYLTCDPASGSRTYVFRFRSSTTIQPDLTFTANGSGTGVTVSFAGKFVSDGSLANGTVQIHLSYDDSGAHYECDTGSGSLWAAAWRS